MPMIIKIFSCLKEVLRLSENKTCLVNDFLNIGSEQLICFQNDMSDFEDDIENLEYLLTDFAKININKLEDSSTNEIPVNFVIRVQYYYSCGVYIFVTSFIVSDRIKVQSCGEVSISKTNTGSSF